MSQALYRKYRTRGFNEVVGQRHVTDLLENAVKNGQVSHAYLFTGPHGTGKTSVARILAHMVNDLSYTDDSTHLDIIEIDAASNRRIDDIRDLREKVHVTPTSARYKVYIIDEVHMLTGESFNALLKTLEEPPSHVIFILATTELHKVPATIVSRTQRFHFRPGSPRDIADHLRMIADKEHISITDDALELIAEHSDGGFRDSVSLLDQVSSLDSGEITHETIEHLLGLAPHQQIATITDHLINHQSVDASRLLHQLLYDGMSPHIITSQLTKSLSRKAPDHPHLYDMLYDLIEVPKSHSPQLKLLALIGRDHSLSLASPTKPPTAKTTPPSNIDIKPTEQESTPQPVASPPKKTTAPQPPVTSSEMTWDTILTEVHAKSPALYSILKRANVSIADTAITIAFPYELHRKKLRDDRNRHELARIITSLYGSCPEIIVDDETHKLDADEKAVADIMGGGEAIKL